MCHARGRRGVPRRYLRPGPLAVVAALLALLALPRRAAPAPQSFAALECAVNAFAAQLAASKLPPAAESDVRDALNVDLVCGNSSSSAASATAEAAEALAPHAAAIALERARHAAAREELRDSVTRPGAVATFFVATDGSDATGDGSEARPFATLPRAAAAARAVPSRSPGDVTVFVRAGTYYMGGAGGGGGGGGGGALVLSEADSNVAWAAFPGDAPAPVVLSGAVHLGALSWANTTAGAVPGILVATVGGLPPDARTLAWQAAHPGEVGRAGPPPLVASLFVNGVRQVRARYPNGNPQDTSGVCFSATQRPGEGCAGWSRCGLRSNGQQEAPPLSASVWDFNSRCDSPTFGCAQCGPCCTFDTFVWPPPPDHPVYNSPLPGVGFPNASVFSPLGSIFSRPRDMVMNATASCDNAHWARVAAQYAGGGRGAVAHVMHGEGWGGWMFAIDNVTLNAAGNETTIAFAYGGYQEARGSGIGSNAMYVENVLAEIDAPGEWFFDAEASLLYLLPNMSLPELRAATLAMPVLDSVIVVNGSQSAPGAYAAGISFAGFTVTQTRSTFLEQAEVPSGGDWTVHRGAALFVQDAERVTVAGLRFDQVGGNALMFSNHVVDSAVADCDFRWSGDSAILMLGATEAVDAGKPTYPNRNAVERCSVIEVGVFGKQTSAFAQFLTANSTVRDCVFLNGPRAGVNVNDGAFGGSLFEGNVVANFVRETLDHGVVNTWVSRRARARARPRAVANRTTLIAALTRLLRLAQDRYPYLSKNGVDDGYGDSQGRSIVKANDTITGNLLINGYSGVWALDHDDGSCYWRDHDNFLVFGGCKNFLGSHKSSDNNVILYPGTAARSDGNRRCVTDDNNVFAEHYFEGNACAVEDDTPYSYFGCNASNVNLTTYRSRFNLLFSDSNNFTACGAATFGAWQSLGQDAGSALAPTPSVSELLALGAAKVISEVARR